MKKGYFGHIEDLTKENTLLDFYEVIKDIKISKELG